VKDPAGTIVAESESEELLPDPEDGSMGLTTAGDELPELATGLIALTITPTALGASRRGSESRLG
jgi:hypothetical protein